jgi:homoserine kinase
MRSIKTGQSISVFSPATVANVGCGFDVFGFALKQPGDTIHLKITNQPGVNLKKINGTSELPLSTDKNTLSAALSAMLRHLNADFGVEVVLDKNMPLKSGLGSSAASAVGGVFALNQLLKPKLSRELVLQFALEGEKIASGSNLHIDNSAACLYGGFILVKSKSKHEIISLPVPDDLFCVIIHPKIEINTSDSRDSLPQTVPLASASDQWANTAALVAALYERDYDLLRSSVTDTIIEPIRSKKIPYFDLLKNTASNAGAVGFGISGSGPSMFALAKSHKEAVCIQDVLAKIYSENEIAFDIFITEINTTGPLVLGD